MKKIINGKIYNTDTADLILTLYNGPRSQRRDYYMTSKSAFFCHYVEVNDIQIIPDNTMKDLLAKYDVDKYLEIFNDEIEEG